MNLQSFETRARTIDHLGRGQIADCPTAVSELWKNAYDAYACHAAMHIFYGAPPLAAVFDDGHGMTADEFKSRWMVIGTESKVDDTQTPAVDRLGLGERPRQGEKGIGRLSAAFLGPVTLVVSRHQSRFVAGLVDWRLFGNPYLTLSDVRVPVEEFDRPNELAQLLPSMIRSSANNLVGKGSRSAEIQDAWARFSAQEARRDRQTTADRVQGFAASADSLATRILSEVLPKWSAWTDARSHGTALVIVEAGPELAVWVETDRDDDEFAAAQRLLQATLTGFVDPYVKRPRQDFTYEAVVHRAEGPKTIVSSEVTFGLEDLLGLEHYVVGHVDENGVFQGHVQAFGVDQGAWTVSLRQRPPSRSGLGPGPFDICLGTFEQNLDRSTHPPAVHSQLDEQADRYAGLAIYRDGLRVMPYGRPEADFFGIEERRSMHAGREFWSYRRTFGRVALCRDENPNLRDKAGREGLIDNTARRELKALVVELLKTSARRFFNADSEVTRELLPAVRERNRLAREAEKKAGQQYLEEFRKIIRRLQNEVEKSERDVERIHAELADVGDAPAGYRRLEELGVKIDRLCSEVDTLTPPERPKKLGRFESEYRTYRDAYNRLRHGTNTLRNDWTEAIEARESDNIQVVTDAMTRHNKQLRRLLSTLRSEVETAWTEDALHKLKADAAADAERYPTEARSIIASVEAGAMRIAQALRQLEDLRSSLHREFADRYGELARAFRQLSQGVELAAAAVWSAEKRSELEGQVERLTALAQLGVTVEIVGHEFESIDERVRDHIKHLPRACRDAEAFRDLRATISELFDRLRFFGPLQLSGPRQREDVTGETITRYVERFFSEVFASRRITFAATPAFRGIKVRDFPSRVVPVFLNLVRNSVYWVAQSDRRREIRFDQVDGMVLVADSGPGVDPDDEPSLFQLFFSRRVNGRGVGLYLCRQNLAAGKHSIEYAPPGPCRLLPGANFIIRFQGMNDGT